MYTASFGANFRYIDYVLLKLLRLVLNFFVKFRKHFHQIRLDFVRALAGHSHFALCALCTILARLSSFRTLAENAEKQQTFKKFPAI